MTRKSEYDAIEITSERTHLLELDEVTVWHSPITGGFTVDAKLVKHEKTDPSNRLG